MQPTLSPGLAEDAELRAGMNKLDRVLGGLAALPQTRLLMHNCPNSLLTPTGQNKPKSVTIHFKMAVSAYSAVHSGATQLPKHWNGEREERG